MISIQSISVKNLEQSKETLNILLKDLEYCPKKSQVFLKPNLVDAVSPKLAETTDPILVGGLILALKDQGISDIIIGEGTGFFTKPEHFTHLIQETGFQKLQKKLKEEFRINVQILNLEECDREPYSWKFGSIQLPKLCRTHTYINLPKMKTHMLTQVSLATKNQKGLLSLSDKKLFHLGYNGKSNLHECILELASIINPEISIVDASRALEGSGPIFYPEGQSNVRKVDLCIGGNNLFEVDNTCAQIMGIPIEEILHIQKTPISLTLHSRPILTVDPPFQRSPSWVRFGNIYLHTSQWACTACQLNFSRILRKILLSSEFQSQVTLFRQRNSRIDVYIGNTQLEKINQDHGKLVFLGNCTKKIADIFPEGIFIPGCPSNYSDTARILLEL